MQAITISLFLATLSGVLLISLMSVPLLILFVFMTFAAATAAYLIGGKALQVRASAIRARRLNN